YPVVAGRDPEDGWMLEPTSVDGAPIFTDTALYSVDVTAPRAMHLVTSGGETSTPETGDTTTTTFNAWPRPDFAIIASPQIEFVSAEVGETTVRSWFYPGTRDAGKQTLGWGVDTLDLFDDLLGEYPYRRLNIVSA